jgi:site-specific DNA recombinase
MSHDNRRNRAILYARVSSAEQVKGYSLDQQIDALRQWALEEGHEVLEEVRDEGVSGAYLERGGLDRVRDLVEEGGISVVVAQDADRITRDPGHRAFLDSECERFGTRLVALDDWGGDTHEGELLRYLKGWMAKGERIKIAERTRRGKLQKARAGKIIGAHTPRFGFRFVRDGRGVPVGYEVDEGQMRIVRMVFSMLGDEGMTLYGARKRLMKDAIPTPSGKKIWHQSYLRRMILDDIYRPHTYSEVCSLVSEEVASTLDASLSYGIFSYDRRSQKKTVDKAKPPKQNGDYRYSYEVSEKPRASWLAIPVPDAGIERALVDRARSQIKDNVRSSKASNRVWEASGGILRCAQCSDADHYRSRTRPAIPLLSLPAARQRGRGRLPEPQELPRRESGGGGLEEGLGTADQAQAVPRGTQADGGAHEARKQKRTLRAHHPRAPRSARRGRQA